jgi:dihydroflavonol-4-reductase
MSDEGAGPVLVTGGSGYVAGWVIVELLSRGYEVRATLRDLSREAEVRDAIGSTSSQNGALTFVQADLTVDEGWAQALAGSKHVLHVASPMANEGAVRAARDGTRRVIEAAIAAGVERVVLTSSVTACEPTAIGTVPSDERVWTDLSRSDLSEYARSKTLAESDAWQLAHESEGRLALTTILPGSIQGPALGDDVSLSLQIIGSVLRGKPWMPPQQGMTFVDVRDLASLHVDALENVEAAGQRFIAVADYLSMAQVATILRKELGHRAPDLPLWDDPASLAAAPHQPYSAARAEHAFGWRSRPASESVLDCATSLLDRALV